MLVSPFRRAGSSLPRQLAHAAKSRACDIPLGIPFEATGVAWRDGHHTSWSPHFLQARSLPHV